MSALFSSPAMLWWTAAAAVPVVIHLLSRRRFDRIPWAAMEFLLRAFKRTRRRLRLENILLLLLRIAALILLALAFADPRVSSAALFGTGSETTRNVILVMDTSYSMDARDAGDDSPFMRSRRLAGRVVDELDAETDSVALVTMGQPAHLIMPFVSDIVKVRGALDNLPLSQGATDLVGALKVVSGMLAAPEVRRDHPGPKSVYVFTDMQKSAFLLPGTDTTGASPEDGAARFDSVDPILDRTLRDIKEWGAQVVFVDTASTDGSRFPNVAVVDVKHVGKALVRGQRVVFEAQIRNFGDQSASGELQFSVNSEETFVQKERVIGLKGHATGTSVDCEQSFLFTHEFAESGWHHLALRFVDDALRIDNTRRFAFWVRDWIRVLAVSGNNSREPSDAAAFFVARALDPTVGHGKPGAANFKVTEAGTVEFTGADLMAYDMVVLADVWSLPPARLRDLETFVAEGGALLVFPGKSWEGVDRLGDLGTVNGLFHKNGQGLLPGKVLRVTGSDDPAAEPWFMQFETFDHPAVAYFKDEKIQPSVTRMPVHKFVEIVPDLRPEVRVLTTFRRDKERDPGAKPHPAIVEKAFGKGIVTFVSTSADTTWNLYGTTPAFVPMAREISHASVRSYRRDNVLVGESVVERFDPAIDKVVVRRGVEPPVERSTSLTPDGSAAELPFNRLDGAGIITIEIPEANTRGREREKAAFRKLAVNVDTVESDLERADRNWLTSQFGTDLFSIVDRLDDVTDKSRTTHQSGGWRGVLYAMLAAMLLETLLAQRFSKRERTEVGS